MINLSSNESQDSISPPPLSRLHGRSFGLKPILSHSCILGSSNRPRCGSFPSSLSSSPDSSPKKRENPQSVRSKNIVRNYSAFTITGALQGVTKKHNQDEFLLMPNFLEKETLHLYGVFDGNGEYGHMVSSFIKDKLPYNLEVILDTEIDIKIALRRAFLQTNDELLELENVDFGSSGTTAVIVFIADEKIYCAYLGDSKSIIGRKKDFIISSIQMTREHKPSIPEERQRIESLGGRVEPVTDDYGDRTGQDRV